jgi:hypothetical protein
MQSLTLELNEAEASVWPCTPMIWLVVAPKALSGKGGLDEYSRTICARLEIATLLCGADSCACAQWSLDGDRSCTLGVDHDPATVTVAPQRTRLSSGEGIRASRAHAR